MRNKYTLIHFKIFLSALRKKKINLRKIFNMLQCYWFYLLQAQKSGKAPYVISIELSNDCNANCVFCRDQKGHIYDMNPKGTSVGIQKGKMSTDMCIEIIKQLKEYLLAAVLYTNGEPLIYRDLVEIVKFANDNHVTTVIASNGLLLDKEKGRQLLEAGLDFIKIQLSGYTQETYKVQVRNGNIEKVKENVRNFVKMNREGRYGTVIIIDYILYNYNRHELNSIQRFCEELNILINIRPGNPQFGLEDKEPPLSTESLPLKISCDWLWKGMQVNWNGDILQCCDAVIWSNPKVYKNFEIYKVRLIDVWNGDTALATRKTMATKGRSAIPMCSQCLRKGISFKW